MAGMVASFPRRCDSVFHLLLFASVLARSCSVLSVAPDDFDSSCEIFAESYQPTEKVLLDTQYYHSTTLLGVLGESLLWLSLDLDGTTGTSFEKWTDQKQGSTCEHNLLVCGFETQNQNNWMITQYVNISRTGVTELLLNVTFTAVSGTECMGTCSESVGIRIFETNEPDETNRNNTDSYSGNLATLVHITDQLFQEFFDQPLSIDGSTTGLYLAVVDPPPGTCVSIVRLSLYYYVCPEQVVNLVKYPEVIAPTFANVQDIMVEATCVDNAVLTSTDNTLECNLKGQWETNDITCSCTAGHYFNNGSCEACPPGTYKGLVGDAEDCDECPNKSNSTSPGSAKCACIDGYYRAADETEDEACTAPPSPPTNLVRKATTLTTISISWEPPSNDGGRSDLSYTIRYVGANMGPNEPITEILETSYTLMELTSGTAYTISVIAENGVSDDTDESSRTKVIVISTDPIGASVPQSVELNGDVLSWEMPSDIRGELLVYQVVFTVINTSVTTRNMLIFNVSSSKTSVDLFDFDVPTGMYLVQVRAVTTVGLGVLSDPINYTEDGVSDSSNSTGAIVAAVLVTIIAVIIGIAVAIAIVAIFLLRKKSIVVKSYDMQPTSLHDIAEKPNGIDIADVGRETTPPGNRMYVDPRTYSSIIDAMDQVRVREIPPKQLCNLEEIGVGEFGLVYKATWVSRNLAVAVKTLKGGATHQQKENFLMEASVMGQFNHPNVVRLCGVVSRVDPVMIIMEFLDNGSLDRYLKKNLDKFDQKRQLKIGIDVATGMSYLSGVGFVHRDLAARNILVSRDEVCKVADFGLAREMTDNEYGVNRGGRIPVRWTAPEAIAYRSFTVASDVWSFGVLLWEIMTYGQTPYEGVDNYTLLDQLDKGMRLEQPLNCADEIYQLMLLCWTAERSERPSFNDLEDHLSRMIDGTPRSTPRSNVPSDLRMPVEKWLQDIQMERYSDNFINQGLRKVSDILELDKDDLRELGITLAGHQHKILKHILIKRDEIGRE